MYRQVSIFDFMDKQEAGESPSPKTTFEQLFEKIREPVVPCANCLCQYCANNAEELWSKVKPDEQNFPCFVCDECRYYTGNFADKENRLEECKGFLMSNYGAKRNRKRIRVVK